MTREEHQTKLAERMFAAFDSSYGATAIDWMRDALDAIGAAGFCVVAPDATDEMTRAGEIPLTIQGSFRAMALAGNLANAPEAMEKE